MDMEVDNKANPKLFVLFVEGVADETNEETLTQYFSKYGEVKHSLLIHRKEMAFVTFADPLMAQNALQDDRDHIIHGRKVDVKPAKPRIGHRKIFVGGLPSTITMEEFQDYFESYGKIIDLALIYDKVSLRFRGFGFVTYDSQEAAKKVLRTRFHTLKNNRVEVKVAKAKEKPHPQHQDQDGSLQSQPSPYQFPFPFQTYYNFSHFPAPLPPYFYPFIWL